jgi:hypothetical protein
MSTRVHESGALDAPVERVWEILRPLDFSFLPTVATSVVEDRENPAKVGSVRRVVYKDGTVQLLKLTELHDGTFTVTWDIIMSEPPVGYTSAVHTIRLRRVTSSKQTLVEAISDYSSDSSVEVIQDSRFKKLELIKALRSALSGQPAPSSLQDFVRRAADAESLLKALQRRMDALDGKAEESKEGRGGGILCQITASILPGVKMDQLVKNAGEYAVSVLSKYPGLRMFSGVIPVDEKRWLLNAYFDSSEALVSYCYSKERKGYQAVAFNDKLIDMSSYKYTFYGPVSAAVKEAMKDRNPIYLPTNGFAH